MAMRGGKAGFVNVVRLGGNGEAPSELHCEISRDPGRWRKYFLAVWFRIMFNLL